MDAATLRCPHCGAAADPKAPRCTYCKARLATISCPSCLALMFDTATFCQACGARRARTEQPADAKCPGCRSQLTSVSVGDTTLLECDKCDGVWLDGETFERIVSAKEVQAAVLHHVPQEPRTPEAKVRYRPCVRCGTMMNRVNFAQVSGTVVDVCKSHGTFLDRGELQSLVSFIQGGGLERARQRRIEDLKEQERRLRDQEAKLHKASGKAGVHAELDRAPWERAASTFGDLITFDVLIDLFTSRQD
jgi:Zn-finger nucleic acid-binding protein